MISDEILATALSAVRGIKVTSARGYNVSPADTIRAALTAALPLIRARVRRAALAEAIEACKQKEREFLDPTYTTGQPLASFDERFGCDQCAAAILKLGSAEDA